jgi:hypothetical protein
MGVEKRRWEEKTKKPAELYTFESMEYPKGKTIPLTHPVSQNR